MNRTTWQWVASAAIAATIMLFVGLGAWLLRTQRIEKVVTGDRLPVVQGTALDGQSRAVSARSSRPQLWLVISPGCDICRHELRELEAILGTQQRQVPAVTVISVGGLAESVVALRGLPAVKRLTVVDSAKTLERTAGRFHTPTMLAFDAEGQVRWKIVGEPANLQQALMEGAMR